MVPTLHLLHKNLVRGAAGESHSPRVGSSENLSENVYFNSQRNYISLSQWLQGNNRQSIIADTTENFVPQSKR